jgi:hypothetical protein
MESELRKRLQTLTAGQVKIMAQATEDDRIAISWLAAMKQSAILFDFAAEVLREKLAQHDPALRPSDLPAQFRKKRPASLMLRKTG